MFVGSQFLNTFQSIYKYDSIATIYILEHMINYIDKYIIVKLNWATGNERNKRSLCSIIFTGTIILTVSYGKSLYLEEIRVLECHALGWFPWECHKKALI